MVCPITYGDHNKWLKVIWQEGRIATAHGRFSRIRQMAPMCNPSSTLQSASAPYWCCPLLSHFAYICRRTCCGHVLGRLSFLFITVTSRVVTWTPASQTRFLALDQVRDPNGISISSAVFAGLTIATDRQTDTPTDGPTDRPRYSVCHI